LNGGASPQHARNSDHPPSTIHHGDFYSTTPLTAAPLRYFSLLCNKQHTSSYANLCPQLSYSLSPSIIIMPPPKKVKKVMTLPINVIFSCLQKKTRVRLWLYEDARMQIEGQIIGFDEYMK
jgi:hypothetical protein